MNILKKALVACGILIVSTIQGFAAETHTMSTEFTIQVPDYLQIRPLTSPVLTAYVHNRFGNLYAPLSTTFRVTTNATQTKTLYLQANVNTDGGYEPAMFEQGGQVYIAFASLKKIPTSSALSNCKMGSSPKDSPGIVAYPVTSVYGAEHKYIRGKNKYEVYVDKGITDVTVNVGTNVLQSSFAGNDPRGFYQAVLSLTEADL